MECETNLFITLKPVDNSIGGVFNECLFQGSLEGDNKSYVTVMGCQGQETIVSIASTIVENGQIDLQVSK